MNAHFGMRRPEIGRRALSASPALLTLVTILLVAPSLAMAQEEDDPFDTSAFDAGVSEAVDEGGAEKLEILAGGIFQPSITTTVSGDFGSYLASGSLSGKAFVKVSVPRYGQLYLSYGLSQLFFQGQGGEVPSIPARSLFVPTLTMSEFHYSFDVAKTLFVRFGNQLVAWGPSRIWTPVDFINLQKADAFQSLDLRIGKPGLRLHVPLKSSNLFAFTDFSGTVKFISGGFKSQNLVDTTNLGLRYDLTVAGFETGLTAFGGLSTQARAGFDISGRLLGGTIYGEAAILPAYEDYTFSWMASLGFERKLGELKKVTLSGEFFHRSDGEADTSRYQELVDAGTFSPTYVGRFYGFASLAIDDLFSPDLATTISAIANLSDLSTTVRLTESIAIPQLPPFSVILAWSGGGEGKAFTWYTRNNSLSLTIQSRIEF